MAHHLITITQFKTVNIHNEYRRKKQKLELQQSALQGTARDNKELQRLIREIRESQNLEKAKELAVHLKEERKELENTVTNLSDSIYEMPLPTHESLLFGL